MSVSASAFSEDSVHTGEFTGLGSLAEATSQIERTSANPNFQERGLAQVVAVAGSRANYFVHGWQDDVYQASDRPPILG